MGLSPLGCEIWALTIRPSSAGANSTETLEKKLGLIFTSEKVTELITEFDQLTYVSGATQSKLGAPFYYQMQKGIQVRTSETTLQRLKQLRSEY